MPFDPDAYLGVKSSPKAGSSGFDPDAYLGEDAPMSAGAESNAKSIKPLGKLDEPKKGPEVSQVGTFSRAAAEGAGTIPTMLAGAGAGARLGAIYPVLGPVATPVVGGLTGGIIGGMLGHLGITSLEQVSDSVFGTKIMETKAAQDKAFPWTSKIGTVAGTLVGPGMAVGLPRTVAEAAVGGTIMGGVGAGMRAVQGQDVLSPGDIALDVGSGMLGRPTALGEKMLGTGRTAVDKIGQAFSKKPEVPKTDAPPEPTVSDEERKSFLDRVKDKAPLTETAFRDPDGNILKTGPKHPDELKANPDLEPGFVDPSGRFYTRTEADAQARKSEQIPKDYVLETPTDGQVGLHSNDLRKVGDERFKVEEKPPTTSNNKAPVTREEHKDRIEIIEDDMYYLDIDEAIESTSLKKASNEYDQVLKETIELAKLPQDENTRAKKKELDEKRTQLLEQRNEASLRIQEYKAKIDQYTLERDKLLENLPKPKIDNLENPAWEEVHDIIYKAKTVGEALKKIEESGIGTRSQKWFAKLLATSNLVNEASLQLRKDVIPYRTDDGKTGSAKGLYHPDNHRVDIGKRGDFETVLHEATHAAVWHLMHDNQSALAQKMNTLYEMHKASASPEARAEYGYDNVHEFVSEGMNNDKFKAHLKRTKSTEAFETKTTNLWDKFKQIVHEEIIAKLRRDAKTEEQHAEVEALKNNTKTALDEVMDIASGLIEESKNMKFDRTKKVPVDGAEPNKPAASREIKETGSDQDVLDGKAKKTSVVGFDKEGLLEDIRLRDKHTEVIKSMGRRDGGGYPTTAEINMLSKVADSITKQRNAHADKYKEHSLGKLVKDAQNAIKPTLVSSEKEVTKLVGLAQRPKTTSSPDEPTTTLKDGSKISISTVSTPDAFSNIVRMQHGEPISLVAKNEAGEEVGRLTYMPDGGPIDVSVREQDRRKGVATALYDAHEAAGGKLPAKDSGVVISDEARAVRESRDAAKGSGSVAASKSMPTGTIEDRLRDIDYYKIKHPSSHDLDVFIGDRNTALDRKLKVEWDKAKADLTRTRNQYGGEASEFMNSDLGEAAYKKWLDEADRITQKLQNSFSGKTIVETIEKTLSPEERRAQFRDVKNPKDDGPVAASKILPEEAKDQTLNEYSSKDPWFNRILMEYHQANQYLDPKNWRRAKDGPDRPEKVGYDGEKIYEAGTGMIWSDQVSESRDGKWMQYSEEGGISVGKEYSSLEDLLINSDRVDMREQARIDLKNYFKPGGGEDQFKANEAREKRRQEEAGKPAPWEDYDPNAPRLEGSKDKDRGPVAASKILPEEVKKAAKGIDVRSISSEAAFMKHAEDIYASQGEAAALKFFEDWKKYKGTWAEPVKEVEKFVGMNLNTKMANERIIHNEAHKMTELVPKNIREEVARAIDKGEADKLTGPAKELAERYQTAMKDIGERAVKEGVVNGLLENYVTHIVNWSDMPKGALEELLGELFGKKGAGLGGMTPESRFGKERKVDTFENLEKTLGWINDKISAAGKDFKLEIKTTDVAEIYKEYALSMEKAIENKKLIDSVKGIRNAAGESLVRRVTEEDPMPRGWEMIQDRQFAGYTVHPDLAPALKFAFETRGNKAIDALYTVSQGVKRLNVIGSFFHAKSLMEVLSSAHVPLWTPVKEVTLGIADKMLGTKMSGITQAVARFKEGGLGDSTDKWIKSGLVLEVPEDVTKGLLASAGKFGDSMIGKYGPKTRVLETSLSFVEKNTLGIFDKITWDFLHTGGKLYTADKYLEKQRLDAMKSGKEFNEDLARSEITQFINRSFGGLNWFQEASKANTEFGKRMSMAAYSPQGRKNLQMVLFAPDWTISTIKAFTSALPEKLSPKDWHPIEGIKGMVNPTTKADYARLYQFKTALLYFTLLNAINMVTANRPIWENKDPTRIEFPDGTSMQAMKHAMEPYHWLSDPASTLTNKLGFLPKAAITGLTGLEYASPYAPKLVDPSLANRAGVIAKSALPFQISAAVNAPEGEGMSRAISGTMGFPIYGKTAAEKKLARSTRAKEQKEVIKKYKDKARERGWE